MSHPTIRVLYVTALAVAQLRAPESLRVLIERELAEFLGPMAPLICEEHLVLPDSGKRGNLDRRR